MPTTQQALFSTVSQSDPLKFWSNHGCDFKKVSEFLNLDNNELSKLGGVSRKSVRLDDKIPLDLKERLEQIANIITLVAEYFEGDPGKTALWFKIPNPLLGEISPRDMIRNGRYKRLMKFISAAQQEVLMGSNEFVLEESEYAAFVEILNRPVAGNTALMSLLNKSPSWEP